MSHRVLIIDDDPGLLTLVRLGLERGGYEVVTARCGEEGLHKAYATHPDVVVLDIMMPGIDGWMVCQRLSQICDSPVIILTARSDALDVVRGLSIGATDYMTKPFKLDELKARLLKALDQASQNTRRNAEMVYDDGLLCIDPVNDIVMRDAQPVDLTPTESRLLNCLVCNRGRIVPHEELLTHVWGPQYTDESKYLSVYIRYLREKIEHDPSNPRYILTKHRVGYYFKGKDQ